MPEKSHTRAQTALNGICPYFTMFPLDFPLGVLKERARPGEWVLDPFCGRGTTNFASRLLGLPSLGIDSSPVAAAIAAAKVAVARPEEITTAAREILSTEPQAQDVPAGEFWSLAYHEEVLPVICRLREALLRDCRSDARKALRAVLLGALHGPRPKSRPSYLSNQAPRTYAPKPRYSIKYWKEHDLRPEKVDVLQIIDERAWRYYAEVSGSAEGVILQGDSREPELFSDIPGTREISWVITSPPYYGMRSYLSDQWLRLWFLGGSSSVNYTNVQQLTHSSQASFSEQLRKVWQNLLPVCASDAQMVIRFGGINDRKVKPLDIIRSSLKDVGWTITSVTEAGTASAGRRQSLHFSTVSNSPLEEYDIWTRMTTL